MADLELNAAVGELDRRVTSLNGTLTDTVQDVTELTEQMSQLVVDGKFTSNYFGKNCYTRL